MQGVSTTKAIKLAIAAFVAMLALVGTLFTTQQAHAVQLADGTAQNTEVAVGATKSIVFENKTLGQTGTWTIEVVDGKDNVKVTPTTQKVTTADEKNTQKITVTVEGVKAGNATVKATFTTEKDKTNSQTAAITVKGLAKGETAKDSKGSTYEVTGASTATFTNEKKNATSVTVPKTVTINGKSYKVTAIAKDAFKNNKKLTKVTVGDNVKTIGATAFQGCAKLQTVKIGKNVKTIKAKAFKGDKKLKTVTVKSSKLNKKSIKNMLKGSKIKTIKLSGKAAKAKKAKYQKWAGKKVKVKK